jgi:hypothetical protein
MGGTPPGIMGAMPVKLPEWAEGNMETATFAEAYDHWAARQRGQE